MVSKMVEPEVKTSTSVFPPDVAHRECLVISGEFWSKTHNLYGQSDKPTLRVFSKMTGRASSKANVTNGKQSWEVL
jgi:hypothetical protein